MGKPMYAKGVRKTLDKRTASKIDRNIEYAVSYSYKIFLHRTILQPSYGMNEKRISKITPMNEIPLFLIFTPQAFALFKRYMKKLEREIVKQSNGAEVAPIHVGKAFKVSYLFSLLYWLRKFLF
jgi:hypothetical protein